ncbi:hypothetical protein [Gordonia sp. NPDC003376]
MTTVNPFAVAVSMARQAHALGLVSYRPTGSEPINAAVPLVVFGNLPARPVRAVSVGVYDVVPELDDALGQRNPLIRVQWRFREPGDDGGQAVWDRATAFANAMHQETPGQWPGSVSPAWCYRVVTGEATLDGDNWQLADSYEIRYNTGG